MVTRLTVISTVVLVAFMLLTASAVAAPLLQEPTPPMPPLNDCQCVDEYQANMWQYHPVVDTPTAPELPAVATMPLNCCQDVATYQANLWQLAQSD